MPIITGSTFSWLRRPSPGSELFAPVSDARSTTKPSRPGPRRTIARKDTQVFVAVGNQIRWADLTLIAHQWNKRNKPMRQPYHRKKDGGDHEDDDFAPYKLLKVSVWEDIRQLSISPNGNLITILTSHTVHVAILPDPSLLRGPDTGLIRLKTYTVGPTCHVLSQSPVMSALWHPLGVLGNCLVTVTAEAIVRVWEFNVENRWSFDSPSLTVDLKRLADGLPPDQTPAAAKLSTNRGFSPDSVEMEAAAACFGGGRSKDQVGWAPMTLWIAMREGDVYALCPLLPVKWSPPSTLLPSLSVLIELNRSLAENDTSDRSQIIDKQLEWMGDINNQDPLVKMSGLGSELETMVYTRPDKPGHVPRLQGPFILDLMPDDDDDENADILLTDIYAVGARLDVEELFNDEDERPELEVQDSECLSMSVICLLTNAGRVHVLLDVEGVEGQWISGEESNSSETNNNQYLLHFESIDTMPPDKHRELDLSWPLFSQDAISEYSVFVTHPRGIACLSFSMWVERLEDELRNRGSIGVDVRFDAILQGVKTAKTRVLDWSEEPEVIQHPESVTASVIFKDAGLGYFLLTSTEAGPSAVQFEHLDRNGLDNNNKALALHEFESDMKELVISEPRAAYQPALIFSSSSPLASFLESRSYGRLRRSMTEEIRFSQSTLNLLTEGHRVLSVHIHELGSAVGELFRQCERMQREFGEQIRKVNETLHRVEDVIGEDDDEYDRGSAIRGEKGIQRRIEEAKTKQAELVHRYDALERKVALSGGRELSDKEKAWISELHSLESLIFNKPEEEEVVAEDEDNNEEDDSTGGEEEMTLWKRHQEIKHLTRQLMNQVQKTTPNNQKATKEEQGDDEPTDTTPSTTTKEHSPTPPPPPPQSSSSSSSTTTTKPTTTTTKSKEEVKVPSFIRKQKIQQVMRLLERESALVDATKERLERLSIAV